MITQWGKTRGLWHTDVSGVGRYLVRRTGRRQPFAAFLNNVRLTEISVHSNVDIVKRHVESLIEKRHHRPEEAVDRRAELIHAAKAGVYQYLRTLRGASFFGAGVKLQDTTKGFVVVRTNDHRVYFETMEM